MLFQCVQDLALYIRVALLAPPRSRGRKVCKLERFLRPVHGIIADHAAQDSEAVFLEDLLLSEPLPQPVKTPMRAAPELFVAKAKFDTCVTPQAQPGVAPA